LIKKEGRKKSRMKKKARKKKNTQNTHTKTLKKTNPASSGSCIQS
jgi:hypothetical protein